MTGWRWGPQTLDAKKEWNKHFTAYIRSLDQQKPVIWAGDLNVAPTEKGASVSIPACRPRAYRWCMHATLLLLRTLSRTRPPCLGALCMGPHYRFPDAASSLRGLDNSIIPAWGRDGIAHTYVLRVALNVEHGGVLTTECPRGLCI